MLYSRLQVKQNTPFATLAIITRHFVTVYQILLTRFTKRYPGDRSSIPVSCCPVADCDWNGPGVATARKEAERRITREAEKSHK
jgi:hypothetical protein